MSITVNLIGDGYPVEVDEMTGKIGGAFYYSPHLQPYSPVPIKWVWEQLQRYPQAIMLDVGASAGSFTLLAKHHKDLTVYAFEPVPLAARILRENVYLNGLTDKVTVLEMGVSDYTGKGTMHVVKDIGGLGVSLLDGSPAYHKNCADVQVNVTTIDSFCIDDLEPTLIKIDVEGNEKAVLEGARDTIQSCHPFLIFEYSQINADQYGYPVHEMIEMIEAWGYIWSNPEGLDVFAVHKEWEQIGNT
jgi:FkbM family methyltransferase